MNNIRVFEEVLILLLLLLLMKTMWSKSLISSFKTASWSSKVKLKALSLSTMTSSTSEELIKNVISIHIKSESTPSSVRILSCSLLSNSFFSKLIINLFLLRIWECFICICNFLEFLLCLFLIIFILIRVILYC